MTSCVLVFDGADHPLLNIIDRDILQFIPQMFV